jgi:hypothetical protein
MTDFIAFGALVVSVLVAIVQFSGNRPSIDLEPDERYRDPDNDQVFFVRVRNATPFAVQIRKHRFLGSGSHLGAPGSPEDVAKQYVSGTVNFWVEADAQVKLPLRIEKGKWLILLLHWRRLGGLHLTLLLPLYIIMSPRGIDCLKQTQKKVESMHS